MKHVLVALMFAIVGMDTETVTTYHEVGNNGTLEADQQGPGATSSGLGEPKFSRGDLTNSDTPDFDHAMSTNMMPDAPHLDIAPAHPCQAGEIYNCIRAPY